MIKVLVQVGKEETVAYTTTEHPHVHLRMITARSKDDFRRTKGFIHTDAPPRYITI